MYLAQLAVLVSHLTKDGIIGESWLHLISTAYLFFTVLMSVLTDQDYKHTYVQAQPERRLPHGTTLYLSTLQRLANMMALLTRLTLALSHSAAAEGWAKVRTSRTVDSIGQCRYDKNMT